MRKKNEYSVGMWSVGLLLLQLFSAAPALAAGNIDGTNKFAWAENAGWQNWSPTYGGVTVTNTGAGGYLFGYAWGEDIGWVKLGADGGGPYANTGPSNYGVNMDFAGRLSGYAWSENCGWISFCVTNGAVVNQVTISPAGVFDGFAWAENIGYVHLKNVSPAYNVRYTALTVATGNIDGTGKFAWAENAGWQNLHSTYGGVAVVNDGSGGYLSGYAWGENIGWVKLGANGGGPYANTGPNDYGVNLDASRKLSGYAWSETCGWVNFCTTNGAQVNQVTINSSGSFDGFAWAENIGFIHFKSESPVYGVRYSSLPSGSVFRFR